MITSTLVMPVIAITTLATVVFIGLGFLPRPSRATALWSAAFAVAMVGSYVWLAHEYAASEQLRALGSGLVLSPMPLIWSGIRAYRGHRRQHLLLSCAFMALAPVVLLASTFVGFYGVAFRVVFTVTGVFAALMLVELIGLGTRLRDEALPLMGVSAAYLAFAVIIDINGVLVSGGDMTNGDSLEFVRTLNMIGVTVYVVCALVSTLLLTIHSDETSTSPRQDFERTARNRLDRARAANDEWWSMLDIRLDDPDDIRAASSTAAFHAVAQKFGRDVDSVLPPDADIDRITTTRFVALVPRPQGGVRELITELLERMTTMDEQQSVPVRLSASIGWAPVSAAGYDFARLIGQAADAADSAYANGGDRWERVHTGAE